MSNKVEKTFEERLESLKKGCIILGVLQVISLIFSISNFINKKGNITAVLLSIALIAMLYFIYKYTKERNSTGPILETIYGVLLLIDGIIYCLSIIGILFGIINIFLAISVFNEAAYFKKEIQNNNN